MSAVDKTEAAGTIFLDEASSVTLDVTVVFVNNPTISDFAHTGYTVQFAAAAAETPGPTAAMPIPPPVAPPVAPAPTMVPVKRPTAGPTGMPMKAPTKTPTVAPVVAPTQSPTVAPIPNTMAPTDATDAPVVAPTQSPTQAQVVSTMAPTIATDAPTLAPVVGTMAPTNATEAPTLAPNTASPTSMNITAPPTSPVGLQGGTVLGITVIFAQTLMIPDNQRTLFTDTISTWFDAFYNSAPPGRHTRGLQRNTNSVTDMNSEVNFISQDVAAATNTVTNTVVYSQTLSYLAAANEADTLSDLVLAPWRDNAYNQELAATLRRDIPAFANLPAGSIAVPTIVPTEGGGPTPTSPIVDSKSEDSSTNPALYSLAALALLPIAGVGYFFYRRKQSKNADAAVSVNDDDEVGPARPAAARSNRQQQGGGGRRYLPANKDQARSVNPSSPLGSRNPHPNQPITAAAAVREREDPPTVQAVPASTSGYLPDQKDQCRHVPLENRSDDPPLATAVVINKETMSSSDNV